MCGVGRDEKKKIGKKVKIGGRREMTNNQGSMRDSGPDKMVDRERRKRTELEDLIGHCTHVEVRIETRKKSLSKMRRKIRKEVERRKQAGLKILVEGSCCVGLGLVWLGL